MGFFVHAHGSQYAGRPFAIASVCHSLFYASLGDQRSRQSFRCVLCGPTLGARREGFMRVSRRSFLGGTSVMLAGCAARRGSVGHKPAACRGKQGWRQFAFRPIASSARLTGLRPFRPSGFVVRGEKRGDKTVVHNYGHGGDGSTCSGERSESEARGCAVLGCGVVGLSTERLL